MNYFTAPNDNLNLEYIKKVCINYFRSINKTTANFSIVEGKRGRKKQFERQLFLFICFELQKRNITRNKFTVADLSRALKRDHSVVVFHKNKYRSGNHLKDWTELKDNFITNHFFTLLSNFTGEKYYEETRELRKIRLKAEQFDSSNTIRLKDGFYMDIEELYKLKYISSNTLLKNIRDHKTKAVNLIINNNNKTYVKIERRS